MRIPDQPCFRVSANRSSPSSPRTACPNLVRLGPGLLESTYQACLAEELRILGVQHNREVAIPVCYKGLKLDCGFRADFLVADEAFVELKSVKEILPVHSAQLLTYMRLAKIQIGVLLNFNETRMVDGIRSFHGLRADE